MRRQIQMFVSVVVLLGSIAGAVALSHITYWRNDGYGTTYTPGWAHWLAVGLLIVGVASPIVTWPRPIIMWRRPKA